MLVSPILFILHRVHHKLTNERQHKLVSNARNQAIYSRLAKINIIFFFAISGKSLLRAHPIVANLFVNVNHELKNQLQHIFNEILVFFSQGRLSFNHGYGKL